MKEAEILLIAFSVFSVYYLNEETCAPAPYIKGGKK
jgi:hypothetical protein